MPKQMRENHEYSVMHKGLNHSSACHEILESTTLHGETVYGSGYSQIKKKKEKKVAITKEEFQ